MIVFLIRNTRCTRKRTESKPEKRNMIICATVMESNKFNKTNFLDHSDLNRNKREKNVCVIVWFSCPPYFQKKFSK